ncbi:MAG: DMSO reductase [Gracilibacter sp. BRH_c7a]|nr:MAG: DMSO reductase [Gracilibacter sp. BRH_c7a]
MYAEEWPLLMFTLLSQLAIGTFLIMTLVYSILESKNSQLALEVIKPGMRAVGPLMAVALLLSLFHLGRPFGAYLSISNLGSSWLSREIITTGGFFALWLVSYYLYRKGSVNKVLNWVACLTGLAAVYSMAGIYSSSIKPAWTDVNTFIAFFGTTFVLGIIGASGSILYSTKNSDLSAVAGEVLKKLGFIAVFAALIPLLYLPVFIAGLSAGSGAAQSSAQLLSSYGIQLFMRWALSLTGLGLLFYVVYKQIRTAQEVPMNMVYLSLALVLVGEFLGRYLFYAIGVPVMIG